MRDSLKERLEKQYANFPFPPGKFRVAVTVIEGGVQRHFSIDKHTGRATEITLNWRTK